MFDKKSKKQQLIFIVEDNTMYAKTLQAFLTLKFESCAKVETYPVGEICLDNLFKKPDVVIMDYYLNSKFTDAANGLDMAAQVKAHNPKTEVIVLSAQTDMEVVIEAVQKVQCNYVIKNDHAYERIEKIIGSHIH